MKTVLYRTLVTEFYRQNTGFFLVIVMLGFGIIRSDDHVAVFQYAMTSPSILLYYFAVWTLYAVKIIGFVRQQFRHPAYRFLHYFRLISTPQRVISWLTITISLLLPILAYAFWMSLYAIQNQQWMAIITLILFFAAISLLALLIFERTLRQSDTEAKVRTFAQNWPLPYPLFFIQFLLRKHAILVLVTKFFSGALLLGVCLLYPTDDYDERLLAIGLLLGSLIHLGLTTEHYTFEHEYLLFVRNLPLSFGKRFTAHALQMLLIFIPEIILLFRYLPDTVSFLFVGKAFVFISGIQIAALHRVYQHDKSLEKLSAYGLWGFIVGLLLIMFHVDLTILGGFLWGYAAWINAYKYYQSEFQFD
ncbi:hypothetical protein BWI96_17205 [Siphonobacter sp. SORGH_AS_0500]|uniref:hypothetical protein n=1 Tax=Siphonobacter sp. SORGH_AS_0500 TaxID=1864824 RepID=UPI000CC7A1EC|nr:hypothetical protein [Siphonobacter sp. SORGH_AS_0500]PKK35445.1 hypothetical protein BWI96_17205 [Siphonobacter sp. SORGH_AS_0500]